MLDELDACQRASKNEPSEGVFRGGQLDKIDSVDFHTRSVVSLFQESR